MERRTFTGAEIFVTVLALSAALQAGFWFAGAALGGKLDDDHRFLAESLAEEPLRILRTFEAEWLRGYADHPVKSLLPGWQPVREQLLAPEKYPSEAVSFKRNLVIEPVSEGSSGMRIRIEVIPAEQSPFIARLCGNLVVREAVRESP